MRLWEEENCRLFFVVYPAFVEALPAISATAFADGLTLSAATLSRDNFITELRDEIKKVGITFSAENSQCELHDDCFHDARSALEIFLFFFEDLVLPSIIETIPDGVENEQLVQKFPKLVRLKLAISRQHVGRASDLISFGMEPTLYLRITSAAHSFNLNMKRIYSRSGGVSDGEPFRPVRRDEQAHSASFARALRLSEAAKRAFASLERVICHEAERLHEGHVRLSDFDQPELDMLLSICGVAGRWQQAYFRLGDESEQGITISSMCSELKQSLRLQRAARVALSETGIRRVSGTKDRIRGPQLPAKLTLGQLLRDEKQRRQESPSQRILKHNKKRGLGVKIAAALLYLFGSPLLPEARPWNADSIYILYDDSSGKDSDPQAYVSFRLGSDQAASADIHADAEDGDPALLALTAILLELEIEREIVPCDQDIDELSEKPSLYMAVTRHHDDLEDNVDANFYDIIEDCLQLYADSRDMGKDGYHVKIQAELFNKVVVPLTERYDTLRNARQTITSAETTRQALDDENCLSTRAKPATGQAGHIRGADRQMDTIAEIAEPALQYEAQLIETSYTSLTISEPQFLAGTISSSWTWLQKVDRTNDLMDRICAKCPARRRVRIAVLDTGCDPGADCVVSLPDGEARLVGHWEDWAGGSRYPVDEDAERHGTSVAALLLRVARHAEVFVGRIARDKKQLAGATDNIAKAISHAATTWDVDIVSMSFGFSYCVTTVEKAISEVVARRRETGRDILFFAAANNDGLNSMEMFPASDPNVISVRGTDHSGAFVQGYNPSPWPEKAELPRFATLATDVPYDCADRTACKSGCSIAAPILAGILATVVQYVGHVAAADANLQRRVRTRAGILQVMDHMAHLAGGDRRHKYVAPWKFFELDDVERIAMVRTALAALQRSR